MTRHAYIDAASARCARVFERKSRARANDRIGRKQRRAEYGIAGRHGAGASTDDFSAACSAGTLVGDSECDDAHDPAGRSGNHEAAVNDDFAGNDHASADGASARSALDQQHHRDYDRNHEQRTQLEREFGQCRAARRTRRRHHWESPRLFADARHREERV